MKRICLFLSLLFCLSSHATNDSKTIDLSGTWQFALDRQKQVQPDNVMTETVQLPGTTDTNKTPLVVQGQSVVQT